MSLQKSRKNGAGEILLTSMDRDGTKSGYDVDLLKTITKKPPFPMAVLELRSFI